MSKKVLKTLYYKARTGALHQWKTWSENDVVYTEYGRVDGKMQTSNKKCHPTNVGKANYRDACEQARFESQSLWTNKVERKYSESPERAETVVFLPMLAHKFKPGHKIRYPADVQPKLDGVRCIAYKEDGQVNLMSRSGKYYQVAHIAAVLQDILQEDDVFDGELYVHGLSCQLITSLVKRPQQDSLKVSYYVYDYPIVEGDERLTWKQRSKALADKLTFDNTCIRFVDTIQVETEDEIYNAQMRFIEEGYEGAIVRVHNGIYEWGYRSPNLLKVKSFQDSEYKVVSCEEGRGKFANCAIWVCETKKKQRFNCVFKGTMEVRQSQLRNANKYIGRFLTIRYFNLTDDGVPRFPVGIVFRADEDLPNA